MQTSIAHYAARTLMRVNEGKMTDECAAWRSRDVDGRGDAEKGRPRSARRPSGRRRTGGKRRQRKRAARSGVRRKARGPCREKRDGGNDERHGGRHGEDRGEKCVGMQKNREVGEVGEAAAAGEAAEAAEAGGIRVGAHRARPDGAAPRHAR
ncbi:hypothetical protein ISF74_12710 [Burkholderia pseudomallei]|nr:hypothetical protein [Burkholderia pseudomallei]